MLVNCGSQCVSRGDSLCVDLVIFSDLSSCFPFTEYSFDMPAFVFAVVVIECFIIGVNV